MSHIARRFRKAPLLHWLSLSTRAALLALAIAVLAACDRPEPLRFEVTFESAGGLERGDKVFHRDIEVGEVTSVEIDEDGLVRVGVEVPDRYRHSVAANSTIRIDRYGLRRRSRLLVEDDPATRIPMREGAVLRGSEGAADDLFEQIKIAARDAMDRATELAGDLEDRLRELPESPEVQAMREEMRKLGERAVDRGRESVEAFREEQAPRLRERAEEVRDRMREQGLAEEAEEFWRNFEAWIAERTSGAEEGSSTDGG